MSCYTLLYIAFTDSEHKINEINRVKSKKRNILVNKFAKYKKSTYLCTRFMKHKANTEIR